MVFWICQKWSFPWWSLKLLSQITDLRHFKQNWLNNFRLHQGKDHFWQIEKTMHQFCSVQLYPELTNQGRYKSKHSSKVAKKSWKKWILEVHHLAALSLDDSGTRTHLRLCNWRKSHTQLIFGQKYLRVLKHFVFTIVNCVTPKIQGI